MKNFDDIQSMWHEQDMPIQQDVQTIVKAHRKAEKAKLNRLLVILVLLTVVEAIAFYYTEAKLAITYIGEALVMMGIAILFIWKISELHREKKSEILPVSEYLSQLQRRLQKRFNRMQAYTLACIFVGLVLYSYENMLNDKRSGIMLYVLLILAFAVLWFGLRPYKIRKQNEKIQKLINQIYSFNQ